MRERSILKSTQVIAYVLTAGLLMGLLAFIAYRENIVRHNPRLTDDLTAITDVRHTEVVREDAPLGVAEQYRFTLQETRIYDVMLAFYISHHSVQVWLDGESIYHVIPSQEIPMIRTTGYVWHCIPLSQEDVGKEIVVELQAIYPDFQKTPQFLLGSEIAVYRQQMERSFPELLISSINILIGLFIFLFSLYATIKSKGQYQVTSALGIFAVAVGLWRLSETMVAPFILMEQPVLLCYLSVSMLNVGAIALPMAVRESHSQRWNQARALIGVGMSAVTMVQLMIQWLGIRDLRETLTVTHIMLLASALFILAERSVLWISRRKTGFKSVQKDSIWLFGVGAMLDFAGYILNDTIAGLRCTLTMIPIYVTWETVRIYRDQMAENQRLMRELEQLNSHDTLTGLLNREQYMRDLRTFETQSPNTLGLILLDINGLSTINQTHGLTYGDHVLKRTANILRHRYSDKLYRVGGDEFVILCTELSKEEFRTQTVKLRSILEEEKICEISMGIAWSEEDSIDVHELRNQAWEMCSAVKQSYYHNAMDDGVQMSHSGYAGEVLQQIEDGFFTVYYQPQMDLETGKIVGAEALVRKKAEDGTLIPPGSFIPFYEFGGVISHVDLFVMRTACADLRKWQEQGYDLRISVNFSRATLLEEHIVELISEICKENQVSPSSITVEVTESISKMDNDQLHVLVKRLKERGFIISLDDFGSKYSNLAILSALEFDEIKFDRSLISTLEQNEKSRMVIDATLQLCRTMGDAVSLAEGIETRGQMEILSEYQCKYGQGYYFSRPLPQNQFELFLKEHT